MHQLVDTALDRGIVVQLPEGEGGLSTRVTDYIAGMTDRFALAFAGAE